MRPMLLLLNSDFLMAEDITFKHFEIATRLYRQIRSTMEWNLRWNAYDFPDFGDAALKSNGGRWVWFKWPTKKDSKVANKHQLRNLDVNTMLRNMTRPVSKGIPHAPCESQSWRRLQWHPIPEESPDWKCQVHSGKGREECWLTRRWTMLKSLVLGCQRTDTHSGWIC